MARRRVLKIVFALVLVLGVVLGIGAWQVFHVEEIPEELESMEDTKIEPDSIVLEGGDISDLKLAELRGKTVFLLVEGRASMQSREGKELNRALNRWEYPEDTEGYVIGDAGGLSLFRSQMDKILGFFRQELRFPLYVDYKGVVLDAFNLPKGHPGFVILAPDGEVVFRHSGPMQPEQIEEVRERLGAKEPEPGPEAPSFSVGELDDEACADKACVIVFLGAPVAREQIPGIEGGAEIEDPAQARKILRRPEIRMVSSWMRVDLDQRDDVDGIIVGEIEGLDEELSAWRTAPSAPEARETFGVQPDETAMIVIDRDGRIALREAGVIPMYKTGRVAGILGIEPKREQDQGGP